MVQDASEPQFGSVNVPLAIFWSEPGKAEYETISLRAATQPFKWAEGLDAANRLWLVNKVTSSAIFGERVAVLRRQDKWLLVASTNQRVRDTAWGQSGWVLAEQICFHGAYLRYQLHCPEGVVLLPKARLFRDDCLTQPARMLSYQVRLPILTEDEGLFRVALPDGGSGYVQRGAMLRAADLCFSRKDIVAQARQFLGLRYIWGGTSAYGFDCSGFMLRLYQSQGIAIPRNTISQSREGVAVGQDSLVPGDLLLFASEEGKGTIHHVGMYVGNGQMIHSPDSRSAVRETSIYAEHFRREYWGARRYACC